MTNAIGVELPLGTAEGGTGATTTSGALTNLGALPIAGGTMTGSLTLSADPTTALEAATKEYVDAIASGITIKQACLCGSTGNFNATYTNGASGVGATLTNAGAQAAFSTDGVSPAMNSRVLIKDQTTTYENGIYTLTTVGDGTHNWVLTRSTDYDTPAEIQPGTLVIVTSGTTLATTSWIQTDTVGTVGSDPIQFNQFSAGVGASTSLNNLITTAVNQSLVPGSDAAINLGAQNLRYTDAFVEHVQTGQTGGNAFTLDAYNTNSASYQQFAVLTAGNPPTMSLFSTVTGSTQSPGDNTTKLATTAFVNAATGGGSGANAALSNLASVAINASLVPGSDGSINLGAQNLRYTDAFVEHVQTGQTAGNAFTLDAYNTNSASYQQFAVLTAGNPPTMSLFSTVTGTTQSPGDNTTKLATTAFVNAATGGGTGANAALSNLASVAINTALIPGADGTIDLGSAADRFRNALVETIQTGTINGNTVLLQAYSTGGSAYSTFATLTAGATAAMSLASGVTGFTQSAGDNSTKLATTAYIDGTFANKTLSNLGTTAINTNLIPNADVTYSLGSLADRWNSILVENVLAGETNAQAIAFQAYDLTLNRYSPFVQAITSSNPQLLIAALNSSSGAGTNFITITNGNPPTCALDGSITSVTQSPDDNSTKLATTAYVDAATGGGAAANKALSNLASVAINASLIPGADNTLSLGSAADRWTQLFVQSLRAGSTNGQQLGLTGYDSTLAANTTFWVTTSNTAASFNLVGTNNSSSATTSYLTIINGNPPTCALDGSITSVTQSNSDNSTKLATTAFVKKASPAVIYGYTQAWGH